MKLKKLFRGHYFLKFKMAQYRLVCALKADGIWDKIDEFWVRVEPEKSNPILFEYKRTK